MSNSKMVPCVICGSEPVDLMGYDYHKVCCSNPHCVLHNNAQYRNTWNFNYTESDLYKKNIQLNLRNTELVEVFYGLVAEYEELLEKSIDHIGSHGTSGLDRSKKLLARIKNED